MMSKQEQGGSLIALVGLLTVAVTVFLMWPPNADPAAPCYPDCGKSGWPMEALIIALCAVAIGCLVALSRLIKHMR